MKQGYHVRTLAAALYGGTLLILAKRTLLYKRFACSLHAVLCLWVVVVVVCVCRR